MAFDSLQKYNEGLLNALKVKLDLSDNFLQNKLRVQQLSLSLRRSGFGLRCLSENARKIPYISSFILCIPYCLSILQMDNAEDLPMVKEWFDSVEEIRKRIMPLVDGTALMLKRCYLIIWRTC